MIFQRADFLARCRVPNLDQLVITGGGETLAIGREDGGVDAIAMAGDGARERSGCSVPQLDFALLAGEATGGREELSIRRPCDGANLFGMALESCDRLRIGGVDEPDFLKCAEREQLSIGRPSERGDGGMDLLRRRDFRDGVARFGDDGPRRLRRARLDIAANDFDFAFGQRLPAERHAGGDLVSNHQI